MYDVTNAGKMVSLLFKQNINSSVSHIWLMYIIVS